MLQSGLTHSHTNELTILKVCKKKKQTINASKSNLQIKVYKQAICICFVDDYFISDISNNIRMAAVGTFIKMSTGKACAAATAE